MSEMFCRHCESELSYYDDLDENGKPFCTCLGAELDRTAALATELTTENSELRARIRDLEARTTLAQCEGVQRALTQALTQVREQAQRIAELEAALADHANTLKHAMDGRTDEQHCGCCAPLRARVAELEEAARWIPVSERLPEVHENVLVTFARRDLTVASGSRRWWGWLACGRSWTDEEVIAWRPLPAPYDPESRQ
jgi:hypothetical protein